VWSKTRRDVGRDGVRAQTTEDRRQRTASQIVNLSNGQMVMNGCNDSLPFDYLTNRPFDQNVSYGLN
jgi:hypothetical protein